MIGNILSVILSVILIVLGSLVALCSMLINVGESKYRYEYNKKEEAEENA